MSILTTVQGIIDKAFSNTLLDSNTATPVSIITPTYSDYDVSTGVRGSTIVGVTPPVQPTVTFVETPALNPNPVTFTVVADDGSGLTELLTYGWNKFRKLRIVIHRDPVLDDAGATTPNWMDVYIALYQDTGDGVTFDSLVGVPITAYRLWLDNRVLTIPCVGDLKASLTAGVSYLVDYVWTLTFSNTSTLSVNAIRRNYSINEISRSEGAIRIGDVEFKFNYADTGVISRDAEITEDGKRFKIVNINEKNLGSTRLILSAQCREVGVS